MTDDSYISQLGDGLKLSLQLLFEHGHDAEFPGLKDVNKLTNTEPCNLVSRENVCIVW